MEAIEGESEQTKEINEVLKAEVVEPDEWGKWEAEIQAQVDKLIDDSRTLKVACLAIGAVSLAALGVGMMVTRAMQQLMGAVGQLGENQNIIAQSIGMVPEVKEPSMKHETTVNGTGEVAHVEIGDAKTLGIDPDAVVGEPHDGPATEASESAKKGMLADKKAGLIDLARDHEEPT